MTTPAPDYVTKLMKELSSDVYVGDVNVTQLLKDARNVIDEFESLNAQSRVNYNKTLVDNYSLSRDLDTISNNLVDLLDIDSEGNVSLKRTKIDSDFKILKAYYGRAKRGK